MNASSPGETAPDPASTPTTPLRAPRPLRAWPAILFAAWMVGARYAPAAFEEGPAKYWMLAVFGPLLGCLLLLLWWLTASRATWRERLYGTLGLVAGAVLVLGLDHPSMRGPATTYLTLPMGFLLFATTAALLRGAPAARRTVTAVLLAVGGFSVSLLLRNEGMTGDYQFGFRPRWSQTAEDAMLIALHPSAPNPSTPPDAGAVTNALVPPEWPGFRGPDRDGRCLAPRVATNWNVRPPTQLWKVASGPGWSSFAVAGGRLFTQEQRGPREAVVCYQADSGKELWRTEVDARLEDPMGGPGPRATPTLADGALYVVGGTGALLRLDPLSGAITWRKELTQVAGSKVPMWGFSSSPLIVGEAVVVYAGGSGTNGLVAFDTGSGKVRWAAPCPENSYGSPQLSRLSGEETVLMLSSAGLSGLDPATGRPRLDYEWKIPQYRAVQPHVVGTNTVLLPTGMNMGTRAVRVSRNGDAFAAEELWTSRQLKPDFVDLVTYQGHAYGNDGGMLTCIDLEKGERRWKGGRYGKGQILLLENSGLLLVLAESGQVVLVAADPKEHREVASFQALEGKTWNHPVVVGDRLYARNAQETAAYRLPLE